VPLLESISLLLCGMAALSSSLDNLACLQQAADEIEVLKSAFADECFVEDHGLVAAVREATAGDAGAMVRAGDGLDVWLSDAKAPQLRVVVTLAGPSRGCAIDLSLPKGYPQVPLTCSLGGARGLARADEETLLASVRDAARTAAAVGEGCAFDVVQMAEAFVSSLAPHAPHGPPQSPAVQLGPTRLRRLLIYSHHIIATDKRAAITAHALELRLGGCVKHGWPGVIIVEGEAGGVDEYVRRLKRFTWKHFEVRGEETEEASRKITSSLGAGAGAATVAEAGTAGRLAAYGTAQAAEWSIESERLAVDALRRLPRGFEELGAGSDALGDLGQRCRDAGLAGLFGTLFGKAPPASAR